ncbi:sodium/potassium-transporting ATPase subunit beta-1-like [Lampetra fluviatilis]
MADKAAAGAAAAESGGWKEFIWNKQKKEFMGRTGNSWLKIGGFYLVFYGCLAALFVATIQVMLLTLDDFKPKWQDRVSPPGLSMRPRAQKMEIAFSADSSDSFTAHVDSLSNLLDSYADEKQQKLKDCGEFPLGPRDQGPVGAGRGPRSSCRFRREWLGPCSGLEEPSFGFASGEPCIIIKMNRVIGFVPEVAPNASLPNEVLRHYNPNIIPVTCAVKREEDRDMVGGFSYHGMGGHAGFPLQYFPYYGLRLQEDYTAPLLAVRVLNATRGAELRLECRVHAANVGTSERDRFLGRVEFKLTVRPDGETAGD